MLFEAEIALPGSIADVGCLVFAGMVVGTGARRVINDPGFCGGFELVFRFY